MGRYRYYRLGSARYYRRSRRFHTPATLLFQKPLNLGGGLTVRGKFAAVGLAAAIAASAGTAASPATAKTVVRTVTHAPIGCPDSGGGTPDSNERLGDAMASCLKGWTGEQTVCLNELWSKESGWSNTSDTRTSGLDPANATVFAYGIVQARPAEKLPLAGQPADLGGQSDPATQIKWGLGYLSDRYGDPCTAWQHETTHNWY